MIANKTASSWEFLKILSFCCLSDTKVKDLELCNKVLTNEWRYRSKTRIDSNFGVIYKQCFDTCSRANCIHFYFDANYRLSNNHLLSSESKKIIRLGLIQEKANYTRVRSNILRTIMLKGIFLQFYKNVCIYLSFMHYFHAFLGI